VNAKELKKIVDCNSVGKIVLQLSSESIPGGPVWYVFAYDTEGTEVCKNFGNELVNNDGSLKSYTSLDRAWVAIRRMGFLGVIWVEG
jgi:hypothetical protein